MAIIMPYKSAAPKIDESVYLAPTAVVTGDVTIEEGTSIWFGAVVRGDFQPIKIGKNTNIQENATIHVMHDHPTTIGEGVSIGSIIMGDTVIGENVVIGAGTMIEQGRKIPSNSLVYGNPAQIIRGLRDDEIEALKESSLRYRKVAEHYKEAAERL